MVNEEILHEKIYQASHLIIGIQRLKSVHDNSRIVKQAHSNEAYNHSCQSGIINTSSSRKKLDNINLNYCNYILSCWDIDSS